MLIVVSSDYLCSAGGKFCNHSAEFLVYVGFDVILFLMTNKNIIALMNEIVDPINGILFHVV
jgi:hypothetical protein